jgi:copper homeostasis protein
VRSASAVCIHCYGLTLSCYRAVEGGAHRLEICGNLPLYGGTTPSLGLVRLIQKSYPSMPLMVGCYPPSITTSCTITGSWCFSFHYQIMIRPRVGDFVYSTHEFETMLEDINVFRTLGVHGVVIGVLLPDGSVDRERCKRYVP